MARILVERETNLRWPKDYSRTLIGKWESRSAWKKSWKEYETMLIKELGRLGATAVLITRSDDGRDPGVAVWFSKTKRDDSWQHTLGLDNPFPTLQQIDDVYAPLARKHHPDYGGDPEMFVKVTEARKQARAWINGTYDRHHDYVMAIDTFKEQRWNLAAIRLAFAAFRQLDRLGVPAILERVLDRSLRTALPEQATTGVAL